MNTPTSTNTQDPHMPITKRPYGRRLSDFGELKEAEEILLKSCKDGQLAEIGEAVPTDDSDPNKIVRAGFLSFLLLGGDEDAPVHEKGVRLIGASIEGDLDLENCVVPHGITLVMCKFNGAFTIRHAHITGPLILAGSHLLQGLGADGARCDSAVFLRDGFHAYGEVRFLKAHIGTDLDCSGGQFALPKGVAFNADSAVVKGNVRLAGGFKATGEVILTGAQIGGELSCSGGQFTPEDGVALMAEGIVVRGSVHLTAPFKATGEVRLLDAQIDGALFCSGGQFEPQKGYALTADRIVVRGGVHLNKSEAERFKATGGVRFLGAKIGGQLLCSGGQFEPKKDDAPSAQGAVVNGDALSAQGAVVNGDVHLNEGFKATGVSLLDAQIDGNVYCSGGQFEPKEGVSLCADRAVIKGSVYLESQFKATGNFHLLGAVIGRDLYCVGTARIDGVLGLEGATIKGKLQLRLVGSPVCIDATGSAIGHLEADGSPWAKGSILNGLVYKSLGGEAFTNAAASIKWLKLQRDQDLGEDISKRSFRPQPWKQLQKVLREMAYDADAREVGAAYEDQLRKADRIGPITDVKNGNCWGPFLRRKSLRSSHWLFGFLAGYGYHPLRLFMSLVGVWLFCGVIYWWLAYAPHSAIGPTDPLVFQNTVYSACAKENNGNWMLCEQLPAEYTTFSPLAYSLDILLPLVDLGQEKRWGPLTPTPEKNFCVELLSLSPPHWVRLLNWFQILYGWVASLLFVAIVSGMARRSEVEK